MYLYCFSRKEHSWPSPKLLWFLCNTLWIRASEIIRLSFLRAPLHFFFISGFLFHSLDWLLTPFCFQPPLPLTWLSPSCPSFPGPQSSLSTCSSNALHSSGMSLRPFLSPIVLWSVGVSRRAVFAWILSFHNPPLPVCFWTGSRAAAGTTFSWPCKCGACFPGLGSW